MWKGRLHLSLSSLEWLFKLNKQNHFTSFCLSAISCNTTIWQGIPVIAMKPTNKQAQPVACAMHATLPTFSPGIYTNTLEFQETRCYSMCSPLHSHFSRYDSLSYSPLSFLLSNTKLYEPAKGALLCKQGFVAIIEYNFIVRRKKLVQSHFCHNSCRNKCNVSAFSRCNDSICP